MCEQVEPLLPLSEYPDTFEYNEHREQLCALLEGLEAPPEFWMMQPPFILKRLGEEIAKAAKRNSHG